MYQLQSNCKNERERERENAERFGFDPKSTSVSLDGFKQRSNIEFVFEKNHSATIGRKGKGGMRLRRGWGAKEKAGINQGKR